MLIIKGRERDERNSDERDRYGERRERRRREDIYREKER